jgi:hypothetical protein
MQISALARTLLELVFSLSSASTALTRPRLAQRLGVSPTDLNPAFDELGRLGLLDPQRLRLTMPGLAVAAACVARAAKRARPRVVKERRATPQPSMAAPISLFSRREAPRAVA